MHRNKVGPALAQPDPHSNHHPPLSTMWKSNGRVQSGMSMEDLKHQTALRLANEQRDDPGANDDDSRQLAATAAMYPPSSTTTQPPHFTSASPSSSGHPSINYRSPHSPYPRPSYGQQRYDYGDRNYTPELSNPPVAVASTALFSPRAGNNATAATTTTSPRNLHRHSHHHAPLQDRGSVENRSDGDHRNHRGYSMQDAHATTGSGSGSAGGMIPSSALHPKGVGSPGIKTRVGSSSSLKSNSSGLKKKGGGGGAGKHQQVKEKDGRVTPVKDLMEPQRILYSTPNTRREVTTSTPNSVYSEPPSTATTRTNKNNRSPRPSSSNNNNNMSHSTAVRSPDYKAPVATRTGTPSNNNNNANTTSSFYKNSQPQSKLPHGLTVQELKEMTRARLAAEANYEADSVHSGGTSGEMNNGDRSSTSPGDPPYVPHPPLPPPPNSTANGYGVIPFRKGSADGISISSQASNGNNTSGYGPPPQQGVGGGQPPHNVVSHPHSRMSQPQPPPPPHSHGTNMPYPYPRHPSPVFAQKTRTDTWETASTFASDYPLHETYSQQILPSFSSPTSMTFNRGRCFSAGATTTGNNTASLPPSALMSYETSSWEDHRQQQHHQELYSRPPPPPSMYYDTNISEEANRRRCATMSPPGMSRLHEDRPFLFSGDEKDRLAIPPLSEPRPRFHSTGIILGSAFEPVSGLHTASGVGGGGIGVPPSPPSLIERVKFNVEDRMLSTGSNGDLPSSVAEAVLESLTASSGPMDLFDGSRSSGGNHHLHRHSSPFRTNVGMGKSSPFRKTCDGHNNETQYSLDRLVTESSGSGSLFSSGPSQKSIFSSDYSTDRLLSVTNSWGGEGFAGEEHSAWSFGFSQEFNNLLNIGNDGPGPRGRAQTAPCFGENHHPFVSQLDPEHHRSEDEGNFFESGPLMLGFGNKSTNYPPGFDKPGGPS